MVAMSFHGYSWDFMVLWNVNNYFAHFSLGLSEAQPEVSQIPSSPYCAAVIAGQRWKREHLL